MVWIMASCDHKLKPWFPPDNRIPKDPINYKPPGDEKKKKKSKNEICKK